MKSDWSYVIYIFVTNLVLKIYTKLYDTKTKRSFLEFHFDYLVSLRSNAYQNKRIQNTRRKQ